MQPTVIREAPARSPLSGGAADQSHPDVLKVAHTPEPILRVRNIQGNILGGFNKDHQMMLYLQIDDTESFKTWLATQVPFVSTASEVIAFNRLFKAMRFRRQREGYVKSTWFNIAFSFEGLRKLNDEAELFTDESFKAGLFQRSEALGDPQDGRPGDPQNWLVGGRANAADVVLIIAADERNDMLSETDRLIDSLVEFVDVDGMPSQSGATIIFRDEAANLPPPITGHEHFGFLDGVSHPGVRGMVSSDPTDLLTPRQNPNELPDPGQGKPGQGKPGQDVLWPGEFVFGYQGGDPTSFEKPTKEEVMGGPEWTRDGSLLVIRRLHQNVAGFHAFLKKTAEVHGIAPPQNSSSARYVGSRLVGRWPSGCPILRSPNDDIFKIGGDDCANNNFEFGGETRQIKGPQPEEMCGDDTEFPNSKGDPAGTICPFSGHIRKSYPRNDTSITKEDKPDPEDCGASRVRLEENDTQKHRMLRRGIPYGPVSPSSIDSPVPDDVDRGLQFLSYQTSLVNQFEFIIRCWVNNPDFKETATDALPNTGHDPIIGQNPDGAREFDLTLPTGDSVRLQTAENWVWATGGGYFFAPSLYALEHHLAR